MTEKEFLIYKKTTSRLARGGINDPTAQIIALAEEIERYRDKIHALEAQLQKATETKAPPVPFQKLRLTYYDHDLCRFVVPLAFKMDGDVLSLSIKTGKVYTSQTCNGMVYTGKEPDVVFGEIIDRLAELENKEEESHDTLTT